LSDAVAGSDPLPGRASAGGRAERRDGGGDRLAQVVFALLVLACFAALIVTQRLKHTPTAVQKFKMTNVIEPAAAGELREEHISFKLARADRVTVSIVSSSGEEVATLVRNLPVGRYKTLSLRWNGRRGIAHGYRVLRRPDGYTTLLPVNQGRLAAPGEYGVQVSLREQDRLVPSPRSFKLVGP
jgi:hypothetical protein